MKLEQLVKEKNIAEALDDTELGNMGARVVSDYELDDSSRGVRLEKWNKATNMAKQVFEAKNTPYPNSSNVKYPLITTAIIQFNARSYPAIVAGKDIVKPSIYGEDPDGAKQTKGDNTSKYMNWQLLEEDDGWEDDTDRLTIMLPLFGNIYRKRWFSPEKQRQNSKILTPKEFVVNSSVKCLEDAPRTTEVFELYPNDVIERIRRGIYKEFTFNESDDSDDSAPQTFFEQHRWEDLDEDGYKEPYIVTVHKDTSTVVRIKPRFRLDDVEKNQKGEIAKITPRQYYIKYGFIPDPEGTFYDIGFCDILYPINAAINTTINQILDAGKLQNTNSGFMSKSLRIGKGPVSLKLGKYIPVAGSGDDIRRGIVPIPFQGPSPVLFNMLGFLIEAGKEISNVKDILTGESPSNETATTTLARIEQGLKVFSAIYKRIYRSLKAELKLLRELNLIYMDPETYNKVLDIQVSPEDFETDNYDFVPVSDPTVVTDMQKMGRAQYLMQFAADPYFDPMEIRTRLLDAASIEGVDKLLKEPEQGPSPEQQLALAEAENEKLRLQLAVREQDRKELETSAKIVQLKADTINKLADAESKEIGDQLSIYQAQMEALNVERGMGGVASPSGNEGIQGTPTGGDQGSTGPMAGGGLSAGDNSGLGQEEFHGTSASGNPEDDIGLGV